MNEMLLANKYAYIIYKCTEGLKIDLEQLSTSKVKSFILAVGNFERLSNHMESLTNVQCDD